MYKQSFAGKSYFYVVGDPALIAQYQASLPKAFVETMGDRKGVAMYCDPNPHACLFKQGRLKPVRKKDGSIGWFMDDNEFKTLQSLAASQPPALVDFYMKQAMQATTCEIPQEYLAQLTPVAPPVTTPPVAKPDATVDAEAFNPSSPIDGE